jgi:hypothetical protein
MKAQSNFDRVRHSLPSLRPIAKDKTRWKALKDGRDRQECQVEKESKQTIQKVEDLDGGANGASRTHM